MLPIFIYVFIFSFIVSIACVYFFMGIAVRLGFVDHPEERKIHKSPTPLLGGAAIFTAVYFTIIFHYLSQQAGLQNYIAENICSFTVCNELKQAVPKAPKILTCFLGGVPVFLLGLFDDKKGLSPFVRLAGETAVAIAIVASGIRPGIYEASHILGFAIAVGWIVAITNAFNLIDGVNGLCAGNAIVSSIILFMISIKGGHNLTGMLLVIFTGSLAGFFMFNFPKGRIFLGSSGSMFIGYTLSVLVLFQSYGSSSWRGNLLPMVMPVLILSVPLVDILLIVYRRLRNRVSIFKADTNHIHHRLLRLRMTDREVVFIVLLLTFAIGINATLLYKSTLTESLIVLIQAFIIFFILEYLVRIKERRVNRRKSANGLLTVHVDCDEARDLTFEGFIVDLSPKGINFCLLNFKKNFTEKDFFVGRKMKLEFLPAKQTFHIEKPFQNISGKSVSQEKVAENAVRIGFEID